MKKALYLILAIFGLALAARAQDEVPPPLAVVPTFTDEQLDQLLGPVALYPDPLIAVMLPASTLPTQIVMADRYVSNGGDPNQMDPQTYDQNVIALAHYPDVLKWMDDNLNWTTQLGQAFANQQQGVMDSIQRRRTQAYNLGNLQSTAQIQVINDNGYIEILPASGSNLYVPSYQPAQVYYAVPSGPPYIIFSAGFVIGPWLCGDFDWHHHQVVCWDHSYPRPHNWWHEQPARRQAYFATGHVNVWNPYNRGGAIPESQSGNHWGHPGDQHIVQYGNPVANGNNHHVGNNPGNPGANWNNHVGNNQGNPGANWNNHVDERDTHNWNQTIHNQPNGRNDDAVIPGQPSPGAGTPNNHAPQSPGNAPHSSPPSGGNWGGSHSSGSGGTGRSSGGFHNEGNGSSGGTSAGGFHGSTSGGSSGAGGGSHSSGGGSTGGGGGSRSSGGTSGSGHSGGNSGGNSGGGGGNGRH